MESRINPSFRKCYRALPREARRDAQADYRLWKNDPYANSLHFKEIDAKKSVWSVRAGLHYRALGTRRGNLIVWFWLGPHAEYDRVIQNTRRLNTDNIQAKATGGTGML